MVSSSRITRSARCIRSSWATTDSRASALVSRVGADPPAASSGRDDVAVDGRRASRGGLLLRVLGAGGFPAQDDLLAQLQGRPRTQRGAADGFAVGLGAVGAGGVDGPGQVAVADDQEMDAGHLVVGGAQLAALVAAHQDAAVEVGLVQGEAFLAGGAGQLDAGDARAAGAG